MMIMDYVGKIRPRDKEKQGATDSAVVQRMKFVS